MTPPNETPPPAAAGARGEGKGDERDDSMLWAVMQRVLPGHEWSDVSHEASHVRASLARNDAPRREIHDAAERVHEHINALLMDYARRCADIESLTRQLAAAKADSERLDELVTGLRVAMRAIGPHYYLVDAAADKAAKAGRKETAERLEYVYGRLFWMDHALGTMAERAAPENEPADASRAGQGET